jgi:hypothetical protein
MRADRRDSERKVRGERRQERERRMEEPERHGRREEERGRTEEGDSPEPASEDVVKRTPGVFFWCVYHGSVLLAMAQDHGPVPE